MSPQQFREIAWNGLWKQNTGLAQLLGLCPILAISTSMVNAVSLGLATILVMAMSNLAVSALRNFIPYEIRIPVFVLIIAALVTVVDLSFNAFFHDLYLVLGIFIPLIVTNCIVLARVEAYAAKNDPLTSTVDGIMMGIGLVWVLAVLGGMRELLGAGTLFSGIEMILPGASAWNVFGDGYPGFLIAILPPGAFFALGVLIAAFNAINVRLAARAAQSATRADTDSRAEGRRCRAGRRGLRTRMAAMKREAIREFFRRLHEADPHPQTELEYASPYQLLVAVVLSAQATDRSVNLATRKLFALAPTPEAMVSLGEEGIAECIKSIGLFRNKAKNTLALSRLLLERHGGEVPAVREALEALPGVGRKTANVVLNTVFRQPAMAVDTHIFRLANRTGLAPGKDVLEVEKALLRRVPKDYLLDAHHWLILHGRYVCTARKPKCGECGVRDLCLCRDKTD